MGSDREGEEPFKTCPLCRYAWRSREDFLQDPTIRLCGYQVDFEDLVEGIFLFNHIACGTTLSVEVKQFRNLHSGPVFRERKTGTEDCPGHCLRTDDLAPCPEHCECAWVREVIQKIRGNED